MTDNALAGHGKGRCKEPIVEDTANGDAGPMDTGTTDVLAPTSGEGWESATDTAPDSNGTLIPTVDTWGTAEDTPVADGW